MKSRRIVSPYASFPFAAILLVFAAVSITPTSVHAAPPFPSQGATMQDMAKAGLATPDAHTKANVIETYGKLPLTFEANRGQTDARVKFFSRTSWYTLFLTSDEAVLTLRRQAADTSFTERKSQSGANPAASSGVLRMKLSGANATAKIIGDDELRGKSNYFIGNDPAKWRANVPTYAKVKYEAIYPGVDLVYYGNQRQLEYDFIVAPGADSHRIAFDVSGSNRIRRDESGDLIFNVGDEEIRWHKPVVYQETSGARRTIEAEYLISNNNRVSFELESYDTSRPLYIDPLIYSTYVGGSGYDFVSAIAVDSAGNAYVAGSTDSPDFPVTAAFQTYCPYSEFTGCQNAFVTKINPTGTAIVYSTYLGGSGALFYNADAGYGIALDGAGNVYVTGATNSQDFPITKHAFQRALNPSCISNCTTAFVTKFNPSGSALLYSTYFGGSGGALGAAIAIDKAGHAYITGTSGVGLPTTAGAFETSNNGFGGPFVTKFNPKGSKLMYSTYIAGSPGGRGINKGTGIAVDKSKNAYITGSTDSNDFPTTALAFEPLNPGSINAFVTKLNAKGSALMYSSYLGGDDEDYGTAIAVDAKGDVYVTGNTSSTDFPVTSSSLQPVCGGGVGFSNCLDAFVTEVNPNGSALVYSTYLGGYGDDYGDAITLDPSNNVYVGGSTFSFDFPILHPLQPEAAPRAQVGFVAKLNSAGSAFGYSTYLGGSNIDQVNAIAVDGAGNAYVAGLTDSVDFPTSNPLLPSLNGADAFVAAISAEPSDVMLYPLHVDFSSVPMGTQSGSIVSVFTNGTSNAFTLSSVSITGANSGDFSQTNTCPASLPAGSSCSVTVAFLPTVFGTRSASVNFTGDASAESLSLTGFGQALTTTTLTSSPNPSTEGEAVTFTAVVSSAVGPPRDGETIAFVKGVQNHQSFGYGQLSGGVATFTTTKLIGTVVITAIYDGDLQFAKSTSNSVKQVVQH